MFKLIFKDKRSVSDRDKDWGESENDCDNNRYSDSDRVRDSDCDIVRE